MNRKQKNYWDYSPQHSSLEFGLRYLRKGHVVIRPQGQEAIFAHPSLGWSWINDSKVHFPFWFLDKGGRNLCDGVQSMCVCVFVCDILLVNSITQEVWLWGIMWIYWVDDPVVFGGFQRLPGITRGQTAQAMKKACKHYISRRKTLMYFLVAMWILHIKYIIPIDFGGGHRSCEVAGVR